MTWTGRFPPWNLLDTMPEGCEQFGPKLEYQPLSHAASGIILIASKPKHPVAETAASIFLVCGERR